MHRPLTFDGHNDNYVQVTCGHCQGMGVCKRSPSGNNSCDSCVSKAGLSNTWNAKRVECGVCGGSGQVLIRPKLVF